MAEEHVPAAPSPTSPPVMDAQMASEAGQAAPHDDEDFYTVLQSAARTELVPQPPQSEATLEYQRAKAKEQEAP